MPISVLDDFLSLLKPLSIYNITENSYIMAELKAYKKGFDLCIDALEKNIGDGFPETCSETAMTIYEGMCGCDFSELQLSIRRQRLIYLLSVLPDAIRLTDVENALAAWGYDGEITVDIENEIITFDDVSDTTPTGCLIIASAAEKLLPAQFDYSLDAVSYTWTQLEELDKTFAQFDGLGFRWNIFLY